MRPSGIELVNVISQMDHSWEISSATGAADNSTWEIESSSHSPHSHAQKSAQW